MKDFLIALFTISTLLFSCSNNDRHLYLRADNVEGLAPGAAVNLNGWQIGKVENIDIERNELFIKLIFDKLPELPTDSKFKIESTDFFGGRAISVEPGVNEEIIDIGDTLLVFAEPSIFSNDSLSTEIQDMIQNLIGTKQNDSILIELRRLNKNLEEMKKVK